MIRRGARGPVEADPRNQFGAFGLTEPASGSDAGSLSARAVRDGAEGIINGEKAWISNAGFAGMT